jgi:hypothetical protein
MQILSSGKGYLFFVLANTLTNPIHPALVALRREQTTYWHAARFEYSSVFFISLSEHSTYFSWKYMRCFIGKSYGCLIGYMPDIAVTAINNRPPRLFLIGIRATLLSLVRTILIIRVLLVGDL